MKLTQKTIIVTGAAGFLGSHLVDRLLAEEAKVIGVDNLITGLKSNLAPAFSNPNFEYIETEAEEWLKDQNSKFKTQIDGIFHLASPASPPRYQKHPIETYRINAFGMHAACELAVKTGARLVFSSTSEAYGEPLEHPQKETYRGNVSTIGVRAMYDESKRFGEMVASVFKRSFGLSVRTARIFNTYGERMNPIDGRVIPAFMTQAIKNQLLSIHGDGQQSRSFCYVSDLIEYLIRLMVVEGIDGEVVNIGNNHESKIIEIAEIVRRISGKDLTFEFVARPEDDPSKRQPDLTKAKKLLGYEPQVTLEEGMRRTFDWFKSIQS